LFNQRFDMFFFFCVPGPIATVFKQFYEPRDGLIRKGSGNIKIQQLISSFLPRSNDRFWKHHHFKPDDGSLLHLIQSLNKSNDKGEYLVSVDIYRPHV
jgi:hypothetical protein